MLHIGPAELPAVVEGLYLAAQRTFDEDYLFEGERHPFHELVYIRSGKVAVLTDTRGYLLGPGDLVLFAPSELHCLWAGSGAISMFILSFSLRPCRGAQALNRAFHSSGRTQEALAALMAACTDAILDCPGCPGQLLPDGPFGGLQMVKNYLEILLLLLMREGNGESAAPVPDAGRPVIEQQIAAQADAFLQTHCRVACTLEQVCRHVGLSKSVLTEIFHRQTGQSVMRRHQQLRLEAAMDCLRVGRTVTETAALLHFSSIHTFSRMFKQLTGVPPSRYRAD